MNKKEIKFENFADKQVLEAIFDKYANRIVGYINSIIKDVASAEDLMMDVFVALIKNNLSFDCENKFLAYVYKCARNSAFNHLKKRSRAVPISEEMLADTNELEASLLKSEMSKKLYRTMMTLKPKYRQVLYLFFIERFSQEEIGQILGMNAHAVKNICFRAKKKLNQELAKENMFFKEGENEN